MLEVENKEPFPNNTSENKLDSTSEAGGRGGGGGGI